MVAIVTGNGVGLGKSSSEVLGQGGQLGLGQLPGAAGNAYVNAATGNLIIQRQDELLIGRGPDIGVYQTYNSQGTFDFDNNDNWQVSLYRQLSNRTGTVNTAGSTITRTGADGTALVYTYDSTTGSATLGKYVNKDGSGSFDTLTYTSGTNTWVWQDDNSRIKESYSVDPTDSTKWRITSVTDLDNNSLTYTYSTVSGLTTLIDKVTSANGEITQLIYNATKQLTQINVINSSSVTTTRIRYTYESTATNARLTSVSTDLTPADGSITDNNTYNTTYTYDGTSKRIASITNSDGSKVSFTYETSGSFRLLTINDYVTNSSTVSNVTTINYATATTTTVTTTNNAGTSLVTTLTYDTNKQLTNVQGPSGSGQNVSYTYNSNGDVTQVTDSRGNWTKYTYDAQGNQLTQQDNLGNTIVRTYDSTATGFNQLLTETVYNGVDATPGDATVAGTGTAQTTRYTYDSKNHIRFTISAEGRVTEYRYNANGQVTSTHQYTDNLFTNTGNQTEAQMNTWLTAAIKSKSQRTDYLYDARGQLSEQVVYTKVDSTTGNEGNGIADGTQMRTQYVYDQSGNLKQKIDARGVATTGTTNDYLTSYSYDGLNRLTLTKQYDAAGTEAAAVSTQVTYTDASRQVKLTLANGLVTTRTYDLAGRLMTVQKSDSVNTTAGSLGTISYAYDKLNNLRMVTDELGNVTYYLYDSANRKVGEIDENKSLTEWVYNNNGQVIRTIQYKNTVTATLDASTALTNTITTAGIRPAADATNDRTSYRIYDQAGRLSHEIDALGYVTEYQYDGASRLLRTVEYNTVISAANLDLIKDSTTDVYGINGSIKGISGIATTNTLALTADATNDRANRNLYDNDGKLVGTLDAEGYLTEHVYDKAGRQTQKIRYATVTSSANSTTGDLATLKANATAVSADTSKHQTTNYIYDAAGQLTGVVDAESFLTEYQYDLVGNKTQEIRYATSITYVAGNTVDQSRPASNNEDQKITNTYDANNRILSTLSNTQGQVNGLLTNYSYDNVGNLTQALKTFTGATSSQQRVQRNQYDSRGNLIAELGGEGVVALLALGSTPTQAQIDTVWNTYGTRYTYDNSNRLLSKTAPNGVNATGNKTLYYYDNEGKLTYTVNALGEVAQTVYNSFDQVAETRRYNTRIASATLAGLTGGADTAVASAISGINAGGYSSVQVGYDKRGQAISTTDELNNINSRTYNAFGELNNRTDKIDGSSNVVTSYQYDRKGLLKITTEDASGINRITQAVYDAFGRVTQTTDGRNNLTNYSYDRLGRTVTTTDALSQSTTVTYDAFDRKVSLLDARGNTTSWVYNATNRTMTMTTAENISVVTTVNTFGEVIQVTDGRGSITSYQYNTDGQLIKTIEDSGTGKLNITTENIYDKAGRVYQTKDAKGTITQYSYDPTSRVLSKAVDPTGLNLVSSYRYDAQGRQIWTQDANGVWTRMDYDARGQLSKVVTDPANIPTTDANGTVTGTAANAAGLNLTTSYTYNARGKKLTVIEGDGTTSARTTQYLYDKLGRLTSSIVDPGTGKLNLTTSYAYDQNDNVVLKTDANGNKTVYTYDANNRLDYTVDALGYVTKRDYDANGNIVKTRAYLTALSSAALTTLQGEPATTAVTIVDNNSDRVTRYAYDKDNRLTDTTDAEWFVTRNEYDANGNVVKRTRYANKAKNTSDIGGVPTVVANGSNDRIEQTVYDAANRATYSVDALNYVTANSYDANGNVVSATRYANAMVGTLTTNTPPQILASAGTGNYVITSSNDQITRYSYDKANRRSFSMEANGSVMRYEYDKLGNTVKVTRYSNAMVGTPADGSGPAIVTAIPGSGAYVLKDDNKDQVTQQKFDKAGRKTEAIDGNGKSTKTEYNAAGDIVKVTDALNNVGYFYTDAAGRVTLQVDPEGAVTQTQYDGLGNVTQVLRYANKVKTIGTATLSTGASIQIVSAAPTSGNSVYVVSDAAKDQKQTTDYDKLGQTLTIKTWTGLTSGTDSTNYYTESYTYNAFGEVLNQRARNFLFTAYTYNKVGNKLSESFGGIFVRNAANTGNITLKNSFTYNGFGELATKVEADGALTTRTTSYTNDKLGRQQQTSQVVQTTTGATGSAISQKTYDARGNVVAEKDANNNWTYTYYDKQDRRIASVKADGSYTTWSYDAVGNISQQTQYANKVQVSGTATLSANSSIQLVSTAPTSGNVVYLLTDAINDRTILYTYDKVGRQTGTEIQNITTGVYNTASNQYQVSTGSITTKNEYDALGNIIKQTDGNGNVTRSWYNKAGQIVAKLDPENYLTIWTRDVYGNISQERRYANKVQTIGTATYTDSGIPTIVTTAPTTGNSVYVLQDNTNDRATILNYDKLNRVSSETVNNVQAGSVNATTGVLTNPTAVNATTSYVYDGLNNITQKTDATSAVTNWVYDGLGRQLSEINPQFTDYEGSTVRSRTDKEYDGLNNVTRELRRGKDNTTASTLSGQVETDDQITTYTYGVGGRLTSEKDAADAETQYEYDLNGNITKQTLKNRRTADQVINNQTGTDDVTTYSYDSLNRQTKTTDLGTAVVQEVQYNSFNQVTGKRTYTNSTTPTAWDEYSQYDQVGRVWKSNSGDGVTKVYVNDKNGNATLTLTPTATEANTILANGRVFGTDLTISSNNTDGAITSANGNVVMKSITGVPSQIYTFSGTKVTQFVEGTTFKSQISFNVADTGRRLGLGIENTQAAAAYRRHSVYIQDDQVMVSWYDPSTQQLRTDLLGPKTAVIPANSTTSAIIEIEVTAAGTTLYIYQVGSNRSAGLRHQLSLTDWGDLRTLGYTYGDTTLNSNSDSIFSLELFQNRSAAMKVQSITQILERLDQNWTMSQFDKRNQLIDSSQSLIRSNKETVSISSNLLGSPIYSVDGLSIQLGGNPDLLEKETGVGRVLPGTTEGVSSSAGIRGVVLNGSFVNSSSGNQASITINPASSYAYTFGTMPFNSLTLASFIQPGLVKLVFKVNGSSTVAGEVFVKGPNIVNGYDTNTASLSATLGSAFVSKLTMTIQKQIDSDEWVDLAKDLVIYKNATPGNPAVSFGQFVPGPKPRLLIMDQPPETDKVLLLYTTTSGTNPPSAPTMISMDRLINTSGGVVDGWFEWNLPDLPLGPATRVTYSTFALDVNGIILNSNGGQSIFTPLTVGSNKVFASTGTAGGPVALKSPTFRFINGDWHLFNFLGAASLNLRYRLKDSGSTWSQTTLNSANILGQVTPGWFTANYASLFTAGNAYEIEVESFDGVGASLSKLRGQFTLTAEGVPTVGTFTDFAALPTTVRFDTKATVTKLNVQYRVAGSTGTYNSVDVLPTGNTGFYWDAASLVPDAANSYEYEVIVTGYNSTNQSVQTANLNIRLGANAAITAASVAGADPNVQWVIKDVWQDASWLHRLKRYNAFGEIDQETDALGNQTDYFYNTMGRLVEQKSAETNVTLANGYIQRQRLRTTNVYDTVGRLISVKDANANLYDANNPTAQTDIRNNQVYLNGTEQVLFERHADGGFIKRGYDIFGNKRSETDLINSLTDPTGRTTTYAYDAENRLTQVVHAARAANTPGNATASAVSAVDSYAYDAAGNRISHTNALGDTEKTYYDSQGRVTKQTSYLDRSTQYSYTYVNDISGVGAQKAGGWQIVTTDAMGRTSVDRKDMFDRLTWHKDLGDHVFTYRYSFGGQLISQTSLAGVEIPAGINFASGGATTTGQNITYTYYMNGAIRQIAQGLLSTTKYSYDAEGNRILESYTKGAVRRNAKISYDELNRVVKVNDARATIQYEYDAVGNKRHMVSTYNVGNTTSTQDYWYKYDAMNRFTVSMGQLGTGDGATFVKTGRGTSIGENSIGVNKGLAGSDGVAISYDFAGQRKQVVNSVNGTTENYTYSTDGYLDDVKINNVLRTRRNSDLAGRVTMYTEWSDTGTQTYNRISTYDKDNRLLSESGTDSNSGTAKAYSNTYYYYSSRNADGSDNTSTISQTGYGELARLQGVNAGITVNTYTAYDYWDEAKQKAITAQAYDPALAGNNAYWKPGYSEIKYDANGHVVSAEDKVGGRTLKYITDSQGIILRREETTAGTLTYVGYYAANYYSYPTTQYLRLGGTTTTQQYYYYNGVRVGDIGNDQPRTDYAQALAGRIIDKKDYKDVKPITSADFDQSYEPIGPNNPGGMAGNYIVKNGDTLQSIASAVWGDSSMWYLIADANGLTNGSALTAGQSLTIPNKLTNVHNNTSTFKVYNPNEALGDLTPTIPDKIELPPPPPPKKKKKKCGGLGGIISAIVTIAVTVVLWPVSPVLATALGNIAGQVTANVMGVQKGFNFKSFATSVATAGVLNYSPVAGVIDKFAAGVKTALGGLKYADVAVRAMTGNAVGQGVGNITGSQKGFSWSSVAVAGIGSAAAAYATNEMGLTKFNDKGRLEPTDAKLGTDFGRAAVDAGSFALTQLVVKGGKINWQQVATDTLTNLIQNRADSYQIDKNAKLMAKPQLSSDGFTGERINVAGGRGRTDVPVIDVNTATAGSGTSEDPFYWENTPDFEIRASDSEGNASPGISFEFIKETQDALDAKVAANWQRAMSSLGEMGESTSVDGYYAQHGYPRLQGTSNIGRELFSSVIDTFTEPLKVIDDGIAYAFGEKRGVISGRFNADSAIIQAFQADGIDALWKVPLRAVTDGVTSPVRLFDGYVRGDAEQIGSAGATFLGTISGGGLSRLGKTGGVELGTKLEVKLPKIFSDPSLTATERTYLQRELRIKQMAINRAASRGELAWSPETDSVRISSLQDAYRTEVSHRFERRYGVKLDLAGLNADHPVDLIIGGTATQRLKMLDESINKSVGISLLHAGRKAGLQAGDPISSVIFVPR